MKAIEMFILKLDQTIKDSKRAPNKDVVETMKACLELAKELYKLEQEGDQLIHQLFKSLKK